MLKAMLAGSSINREELARYIEDDDYWVQPKHDGHRVLISIDENGFVSATNRNGEPSQHSADISSMLGDVSYPELIVLDGEWVSSIYIAFDIANMDATYAERFALLIRVISHLSVPSIYTVTNARMTDTKRHLLVAAENLKAEGLMVRRSSSPYVHGRSDSLIKCKFTNTTDVVVVDRDSDRQSFSFGQYKDGKLMTTGRAKDLLGVTPGEVVELRYLYVTDSGRYYQPVALRKRDDKKPEDCLHMEET